LATTWIKWLNLGIWIDLNFVAGLPDVNK
jgi:hypothetical protein